VLVGAAIRDEGNANPPLQREDLVMWGLTDPQLATRIVMDTSEFYVRQLLVRAMAVRDSIAIHSDQPARWLPLAQNNIAVVDRRRAPDCVPTIVVATSPPRHHRRACPRR
jgi:hypothetical protein